MKIPKVGTFWRHKSGTVYEVMIVANQKASKSDYPVIVIYKDKEQNIWARNLEKWQEMEEL